MHEKGLGTPLDYAAALTWYRLAAEQGYTAALGAFGGTYLAPNSGAGQNFVEALK